MLFCRKSLRKKNIDRVSALGFALGYIGGALALLLALPLINYCETAGYGKSTGLRAALLLLGVWWAVFSVPALIMLRDKAMPLQAVTTEHKGLLSSALESIRQVGRTLTNLRAYRAAAIFLTAFLLYNDSVQTVISQASVVARSAPLNFEVPELIKLILVIQLVALPGSLLMGRLSERWGQMRVLYLCLIAWAVVLLAAWFVDNRPAFWGLGVAVALVMGGVQSVSRAVMGTLTPAHRAAEFFGFYNLSSKATSAVGPVLFGAVYQATGQFRYAIISLTVQLALGAWLLSRVDVTVGRAAAKQAI